MCTCCWNKWESAPKKNLARRLPSWAGTHSIAGPTSSTSRQMRLRTAGIADSTRSRAEQVFHSYLSLENAGQAPSIEQFVADAETELRDELERIFDDYSALQDTMSGGASEFS